MEATTDAAPSGGSPFAGQLDRYFDISTRGSSIATEIRGGAATFLTMAYILFVNPQILGSVPDPGGVKLPFDQVLTVTARAGFVSYSVLSLLGGRRVHPLMLGISAIFVWYFVHGVVG